MVVVENTDGSLHVTSDDSSQSDSGSSCHSAAVRACQKRHVRFAETPQYHRPAEEPPESSYQALTVQPVHNNPPFSVLTYLAIMPATTSRANCQPVFVSTLARVDQLDCSSLFDRDDDDGDVDAAKKGQQQNRTTIFSRFS